MTSDEQTRPIDYRESAESTWDIPSRAPLVTVSDHQAGLAKRSRRRRVLGGLLVAALAIGALVKTVWPVTGALGSTEVGPWDVRINSGGARSVVVLAYGREAGLHLFRVPAASRQTPTSGLLSAKVGPSPLYLISLGRAPLEVSAVAPAPDHVSWKARGRVIQAFKDNRGTGVRTW
jgi:hypothetical protein